MMDMKRIKSCKTICTAMAAVTLVALLAGCNSEDPKKPVASVQESVAASESTGPNVPAPSVPDISEPDVPAPSVPDVPAPSVPDNPGPTPSVPDDPGPTPSVPDDPDPLPPDDIHVHVYSEDVTQVTCTEDGFTTYTCVCGDSYTGEIVNATGHSWSDWVTVQEPTEEATGTAERKCSACDATESKALDKLIPNHTHSYTSKVTKKATCSAEGIKTFSCSCGSSYTEAIAKIAHSYKSSVTKPTCEEKGYTTYTCRNCEYSYKDNYKDKGPHCYSWETVKPTCTEYGSTIYMCDECLCWYEIDIVPATGHSYEDTVIPPTCSEKGYALHKCSKCSDSYKDNYTDMVDHAYTPVETKEPTIFAQGSIKYQCSMCSKTHTEFTDPLTGEAKEEFLREVAAATLKYINQFRMEQGDTEAVALPVLTLIAQERAVQLQADYRHDSVALRELYNQYQYGDWVDGSPWGGSQYYNGNAMEAIQRNMYGGTADEMGYMIAESFRTSEGHWAYVGSSDYTYIGIGVTYDSSTFMPVKICILQTSKNYG